MSGRNKNRDKNFNSRKTKNKNFGEKNPENNRNQQNERKNRDEKKPLVAISVRKLSEWIEKRDDDDLILSLTFEENGFFKRLDEDDKNSAHESMFLILKALAKVCQCNSSQETMKLLAAFLIKMVQKLKKNTKFYQKLIVFLSEMIVSLHPSSEYEKAIINLLHFLRKLQITIQTSSRDCIDGYLPLILSQVETVNRKGVYTSIEIINLVNELQVYAANNQQTDEQKKPSLMNDAVIEAPNDYREMSIFPTHADIVESDPIFYRPNIVNGKYVGGVDHYLDVQFRLLREDFIRTLRQGIQEYCRQKQNGVAVVRKISDINLYNDVHLSESKMVGADLVYLCKFDCKPFKHLRWQNNKRLLLGSLLCFSKDNFETFFFATVAGRRDPIKLAEGELNAKVEMDDSIEMNFNPAESYVMIESQVYFEAYRHNLKILQEFNADNFPLERYLINVEKTIEAPSYVSPVRQHHFMVKDELKTIRNLTNIDAWPTKEDFGYDESQFEAYRMALTKELVVIQGPPGTGKTFIGLQIVKNLLLNESVKSPILISCYTNHALDQFLERISEFCDKIVRIGGMSQSENMKRFSLNEQSRQMTTDRKFPREIHENRWKARNLITLLKKEIDEVEKRFSSASKKILDLEILDVISRSHQYQFQTTNYEFEDAIQVWLLGMIGTAEVEKDEDDQSNVDVEVATEAIDEMYDEDEVQELEQSRFIEGEIDYDDFFVDSDNDEVIDKPNGNRKMFRAVDDGFQFDKRQIKAAMRRLKHELNQNDAMMTDAEAKGVQNIFTLTQDNRWRLYRYWRHQYMQMQSEKLRKIRKSYMNEYVAINAVKRLEDVFIAKQAKIIGMTTTGAAKYRHIINGVKPEITVVEEAAEVLETHIVTSLNENTKHLILIGDHQQLKPSPAVYELAKKFHMDISLFERMIRNGLPYVQLKQQHRMRPCISSLLVPHIYKQLLDHESVTKYENVKGVEHNMYFINHRHLEVSVDEIKSHVNKFEAAFIVQLCRYFVLQGYNQSEITILTMYSGQLVEIRKLMKTHSLLSGVRATVVDNYQGEENEIILLSMVRSNAEGKIGFLKTDNRVNVALSRAKKGLYAIGNFDCLSENSKLWTNIVSDLKAQNSIGESLEVFCQNHTQKKVSLQNIKDFEKVPEGGCTEMCGTRLLCGHACASLCHVYDIEHEKEKSHCAKQCDKEICESKHHCQKKCHYGTECGKCQQWVTKKHPDCGHDIQCRCSQNPAEVICQKPCPRMLKCGHKCSSSCGQSCEMSKCKKEIIIKSEKCGHSVKIHCFESKSDQVLLRKCQEPCKTVLKCGHICTGTCSFCQQGRLHRPCSEKCERILVCGHPCRTDCSESCPPCNAKCENFCTHSKCKLKCGQPCAPCMEECAWRCPHKKCGKLCHETCDRDLCREKCPKLLKCGHACIGICGEPCPSLCRECNADEVTEIFFGDEDEPDAQFIKLVDCKHHFEINGILEWMKTNTAAENESNNNNISIQLKRCPKCNTTIRRTLLLNKYLQSGLRDIEIVKFKTYGNLKENGKLEKQLQTRIEQFDENYRQARSKFRMDINVSLCSERRKQPLSSVALNKIENQYELFEKMAVNWQNFATKSAYGYNVIHCITERIAQACDFIHRMKNSAQELDDISNEVSFLCMILESLKKLIENKAFENENALVQLQEAFEIALSPGRVSIEMKTKFNHLIKEAYKKLTGLNISIEEKNMILKTVNLSQGHWYKCPNGHIYLIDACGGATHESKCNECGARIGGGSHRLRADNALATEMDGATQSAWPGPLH